MRTFGNRWPAARAAAAPPGAFARRLRAGLRILALGCAVLAAAAAAQAQTMQADVDATEEDGFGRIIITFRDRTLLPEFTTRIANGVLQVNFAEPVTTSVAHVPAALMGYVSVALDDPAGFGIRFGLKDTFRINTMEAGEKLFVDILPRSWQGEPPPLPDDVIKELARRAEEALKRVRDLEQKRFGKTKKPQVTLRVGRHPTFTRLSFFWNVPFDTNFQREGDLVRVVFSRDSDLNLYELFADKPPGLIDFDTFEEDGKLKVVLQVDVDVDVRAFREEDAYVVDIAPQGEQAQDTINASVRDALAEQGARQRTDMIVAHADYGRNPVNATAADGTAEEFAEPSPPESAAAPAAGAGASEAADIAPARESEAGPVRQILPTAPVLRQVAAPADTPQPVPAREAEGDGEPAAAPMPASAGETSPPTREGAASPRRMPLPPVAPINTDIAPINAATDPLAAAPARRVAIGPDGRVLDPDEVPATAEQTLEGISDEKAVVAPDLVEVETSRIGNMVRVVFPFEEATAAAVFKRHQSLWLVFDTGRRLGLESMRTALEEIAAGVHEGAAGPARTVRIDLKDAVLATIGADGSSWIINIGDLILEPSRPVSFHRNVRGDGGMSLSADFADASSVHRIRDPHAGDTIFVVTGHGPARGVIKPQRFVELDALTSAHGLAIVSRSDELTVVRKDDRILVEQPRGLSLSSQNLAAGTALLPVKVAVSRPGFVDFSEMYEPNPMRFRQRKAHLQDAISGAGEGSKTSERLALARFFLANRFAHEAVGVLRLVRELDPKIESDSAFLLMMGAANTLAGRPEDAKDYLMKHDLDDSPDADVWRVIHFAQMGNWAEARKIVGRARKTIGSYPPNLQALFNISAADAAVELNDFGEASAVLAEIDPAMVEPKYAARFDILRARLADAAGRPDDAIKLLQRVAEFGQRPNVAEATYRLLRIQHRENLRPRDEIVDDLRQLSATWRGDDLELKTVRFLAQLLAEGGEYREAFATARNALLVDADADTSKLLQEEMSGVFATLFIDGKADELEPVEALGLFYDFKEMTPIGRRGDAIVRNLAERLVDVDLLEQAAELLQHQVDNRLKGAARAQIAADLALIYLLDRKPDSALRALRRSRQAKLPEAMERQRRLVEARALVDSGRYQTALDLLATIRGPGVERMKADAHWYARNWDEAGKQFESLLGGRWSMQAPLSAQDRMDVLKAAIGFALAGNQLALDRLRSKFAGKMANTEHAAAFEVVTREIDASGSEFAAVASQVAAVDTLELFLKEYRERYASGAGRKPAEGIAPAASGTPGPAAGTTASGPETEPQKPAGAGLGREEPPAAADRQA